MARSGNVSSLILKGALRRPALIRRLLCLCLLASCPPLAEISRAELPLTPAKSDTEVSTGPRTLTAGETVSDVLSPGRPRRYELNLRAGQYVRAEILKGDLRLKVSVCARPEQACSEFFGTRYGRLELFFSADVSATPRLEVSSLESDPAERTYELRVVEVAASATRQRLLSAAARAAAEADALRERRDGSSPLASVPKYGEARRLWESAGEFGRAAQALCARGDVYFAVSQYPQALQDYVQALSLGGRGEDRLARLAALHGVGYVNVYLGENQKALSYAKEMLDLIERGDAGLRASADFRRAEAQALNIMGEAYYSLGELRKSVETFERALAIWTEVGERSGEALALLNLGYSHSDLGDLGKASDHFQRSLALWQSVSDERGTALAQTALGGVHSVRGEEQPALNLHNQAAEHFRALGDKQDEAVALNGIASVYLDLNEYQAALDNYSEALRLYEGIGNRDLVALNKFLIGKVLFKQGEFDRALAYYRESSDLSRAVGDRVVEAHALKGFATVYFSRGDVGNALAQFRAALEIYRQLGNRRSQAYVLNDIGHIHLSSGDAPGALASFQEALPLMRETGDRHGEALTLFNSARAESARDNPTAALPLVEDSIALSESMRTTIRNSQLRTSYFSSVHQRYEFYIDLLMRLHARFPEKGYAVAALAASERARARSLLDSLLKEKLESGKGPSADLLSRTQELLQALEEKAEYQTRLLAGKHTAEEAEQAAREIRALTLEYQDVRSRLREQSPRSATLTQPGQLRAEDFQRIVGGDDTLLLEFALGDERSYLWAVSGAEIVSYELPGRATIEALARRVYDLLTVRQVLAERPSPDDAAVLRKADAECVEQSAELSRMLLGPVSDRLGSKRLLIVRDGFLQSIPFDALPAPAPAASSEAELLVSDHEIVCLPSALTLASLRSEKNPAVVATKTIAVIADPVFEKEDPRVSAAALAASAPAKEDDDGINLTRALRDFGEQNGRPIISRLPSTLREANAIMSLVPPDEGTVASGFAASKDLIVRDGLRDYRIIHFATHGLLNNEQPELSGVVLSLVDERGNRRNGFLSLNDIYNLDLSTDLVVLSACRTGLGKNVQGEGVVGLTSGFMYTGAKSVVASLWKVDDDATAELMSRFYAALLKDGLSPAEALKKAKLEMRRQERWHAPFYWAAFVLHGEYAEVIRLPRRTSLTPALVIGGALALAISCYYALVVRPRRRARAA
ncbi:MAG TPA: CHAT domain-containing tetratricopeptide repeat protein [Pyrinomonadaceae bacterium]|jgi:CHAT domain-containing protein/predicted negative regulator of RcsB-dependent stress response